MKDFPGSPCRSTGTVACPLPFFDECGVRQEHMREYAYAPRGERVDAQASGRNRKVANVTGTLFMPHFRGYAFISQEVYFSGAV